MWLCSAKLFILSPPTSPAPQAMPWHRLPDGGAIGRRTASRSARRGRRRRAVGGADSSPKLSFGLRCAQHSAACGGVGGREFTSVINAEAFMCFVLQHKASF